MIPASDECGFDETRSFKVLSPGTARQDKVVKFRLYEEHGVREYWMVDPVYRLVEVWMLAEGKFNQQGIYDQNDDFQSVLLGKKIELTAIFND